MDRSLAIHTLYVGFANTQVVVNSSPPDVTAVLQRHYQDLLVHEPTQIVGQLDVRHVDDSYQVLENSKVTGEAPLLETFIPLLRDEIVLRFIDYHRHYLWLHAGAAASRGSAVVISAGSGRGKSTLVTSLCEQGWLFLSDDLLPLDMSRQEVLPFPQMPQIREHQGEALSNDRLGELTKREIEIPNSGICRQSLPIGAIIIPHFQYGSSVEITLLSPATAATHLLENCANYSEHQQRATAYLCELVQQVPVLSLSFHTGSLAATFLIQTQEQWLHPPADQNSHLLSAIND